VSGRNPDLPILDELGAEFEALVEVARAPDPERAGAAADRRPDRHATRRRASPSPSARPRERSVQARRIGRRAAIVLLLVCLVGGVAFAALRGGGGSGGQAHTAPALLGRDAGGAWSFSVYRDEGRLCTVFVPRGGELSGNCGTVPDGGHVRAGSAIVAGTRYIFGIAGPRVDRVTAALAEVGGVPKAAGGKTGASRIRQPVDRDAASAAGFPVGNGWFVLDLGPVKGVGHGAPAVVTPFTRHGHRAGPAYVDCSLGVIAPACRRRIESAAAAGG
jgi:hypothetical protein